MVGTTTLRTARTLAMALAVAASAAIVVGSATGASAQSAAERIASYDVSIRIGRDASLVVRERIVYDFGANERHGIFRDIPVVFRYDERYDRVYPVEVLSVRGSPGTPDRYAVNRNGDSIEIKIGDPNRTITGRHVYTLAYRVRGALNGFSDHDELYWNAIGTEWDVPILRAQVRVLAPSPITRVACYAGETGSTQPCTSARISRSSALFSEFPATGRAEALEPSEGMTIVVALPLHAVAAPHPILKERWSFRRAFSATPLTVGVTGALMLAVLAALGRLLWVAGRDRRAVGSAVDVAFADRPGQDERVPLFERGSGPVEYTPPEGIRAGQVGTLLDEVANPLDVTATLVDLAVRGYIRIEEIPKKGWFGKPDWRLVKLREPDDGLLGYERVLLDAVFEEPGDPPGAVTLSSLAKRFATRLRRVQDALYDDATRMRWFAGRPDTVRRRWHSAGVAVLAAGAGLTWLAAARSHLGLLPLPLVVTGVILVLAAHAMPRRTPLGTGMVRRVLGFRTYIATAEVAEARFDEREAIFSRYLPYAIVFGLVDRWARVFSGLDREVSTPWYVAGQPFSAAQLSSSVDHFAAVASGTIASAAASGSSGFAGGSGGGGGGGGGGSW